MQRIAGPAQRKMPSAPGRPGMRLQGAALPAVEELAKLDARVIAHGHHVDQPVAGMAARCQEQVRADELRVHGLERDVVARQVVAVERHLHAGRRMRRRRAPPASTARAQCVPAAPPPRARPARRSRASPTGTARRRVPRSDAASRTGRARRRRRTRCAGRRPTPRTCSSVAIDAVPSVIAMLFAVPPASAASGIAATDHAFGDATDRAVAALDGDEVAGRAQRVGPVRIGVRDARDGMTGSLDDARRRRPRIARQRPRPAPGLWISVTCIAPRLCRGSRNDCRRICRTS